LQVEHTLTGDIMNLDLYWAEVIVFILTYIENVWMLYMVIYKSLLTFVLY